MGVEYSAVIVVGLPRDQFKSQDAVEEWVDEGVLELVPYYYDGGREDDVLIGFVYRSSGDYSYAQLDEGDGDRLVTMKADFLRLTGQEAKVWLSTYGW